MKYYRITFEYDNLVQADSEHDALVNMLETIPDMMFNKNIVTELDAHTDKEANEIYERVTSYNYERCCELLESYLYNFGSDFVFTDSEISACAKDEDVYRSIKHSPDWSVNMEAVEGWVYTNFNLDDDDQITRKQ